MKNRDWLDKPSMEGFGILQDITGVPYDPMLSNGQVIQRQLERLISTQYSQRRTEPLSGEYLAPRSDSSALSPINLTILQEHAGPQLDQFLDAQRELAYATEQHRDLQEQLLRDVAVTNDVLQQLDYQARDAYEQRNDALKQLALMVQLLMLSGIELRGIREDVREGLQQVTGAIIHAAEGIESRIGEVRGDIQQVDATLERGFDRVGTHLSDVNSSVRHLDQTLERGIDQLESTMERGAARITDAVRDVHGEMVQANAALDRIDDGVRGVQTSVARVEGAVERGVERLDSGIQQVDATLERGFDRVDARFSEVRGDIQQVDATLSREFHAANTTLRGIESGIETIGAHLQDVQHGVAQTNASVLEVRDAIERGTTELGSTIDRGVDRIEGGLHGVQKTLERGFALDATERSAGRETAAIVGRELLKGLGVVGTQVHGVARETARTRQDISSRLGGLHDIFSWASREQLWELRRQQETAAAALDALKHPIGVRGRELREIGERCRAAGDLAGARAKFDACLAEDPTNAEARMALGLLNAHEGAAPAAHDAFRRAADHARTARKPSLAAYALLHDAHLSLEEQRTDDAIATFREALHADVQNYDCWYGLAQAHAAAGDYDAAWDALQPLFAHARQFIPHILENPRFDALKDRVRAQTISMSAAPDGPTDASHAPPEMHASLDTAQKKDRHARMQELVQLQVEQLLLSERRSLIMRFREQYASFLDPVQSSALDARIAHLEPGPSEILTALEEEAQLRVHMLAFASTNDVDGLRSILRVRPGLVNMKDAAGMTPLIAAVSQRCATATSLLLEHGADPHISDAEGRRASSYALANADLALAVQCIARETDQTPETLAACVWNAFNTAWGNASMRSALALQLLELGADPSYVHFGTSLLAFALRTPDVPLAYALLERGAVLRITECPWDLPDGSDMELVERLLASNPDLGTRNCWLIDACARGSTALVTRLLDAGADPDIHYASMHTPLLAAIESGRMEHVQLLLAKRVDVNAAGKNGATALHLAAQQRDARLARALLDAGAMPNVRNAHGGTPLSTACVHGDIELITLLLERGADPNTVAPDGRPLLWAAIHARKTSVAQALLAGGADVNARTANDVTPIIHAAEERDGALIRVLLQHHASVAAQNKGDATALHLAVQHRRPDIVRELLNAGAPPNVRNAHGGTPLSAACAHGDIELITLLLEHGADPNTLGPDNRPLLWTAILSYKLPVSKALLAHGADPNTRTEKDVTPLFHAVEHDQRALVQILLDHHADVNAQVMRVRPLYGGVSGHALPHATHAGKTALHLAASMSAAHTVSLLLEHGADPAITDARGNRPASRGNATITSLLSTAMLQRDATGSGDGE